MQKITGFGLNVWDNSPIDKPSDWTMAVYPDYDGHTDSDTWLTVEATPERIARYLSITDDDDWWVYDQDPQFHYILWGEEKS